MFPETIDTNSLSLHQLCEAHVDVFELYDLFAEKKEGVEDVFEYVPQEPYTSVKDAADRLEKAETAWDDGDAAQYAVYSADETLMGYAVLSLQWERRTGMLGVILATPYWGQGYAGECATALTEIAFDSLDLDVVAIGYDDENERSKRMIETFIDSVGGRYDGVLRNWTPLDDKVANHHRYTVTHDQYQQSTTDT